MGHQKEEGKNKNRATSKNPFVYSTRSNEEKEGGRRVGSSVLQEMVQT